MSKHGRRTGRGLTHEPKAIPTVKAKPSRSQQDRSKYMPGAAPGQKEVKPAE